MQRQVTLEERVREILETYLQPLVKADGGDLQLVELKGTEVVVRLTGTCRGCPGRAYTLQQVIAKTLREHVDENIHVSHAETL